jgi:2-(1,2-epoxy-1,2-dihydrophenyl)acetyl-CoA isomerase
VVPDDQLIVHAEAPVGELARGPTSAYGGVKRLLWHDHQPPYEEMEVENESIADTARTADAQEGIAAFLAKRLPQSTPVRDSA